MFWADRIAKEIIESEKYKPYWVDDMKTPSGRIHVGSLRGVMIHELVWRALKNAGKKATFTYVFDDHDPMDELPPFLDREIWGKYLGQPLFTVHSPDKKTANYAKYFADEFITVFNKLGCRPQIRWASELYKTGKMNKYVKLCLDKASVIRKIYEDMYKKKLPSDWYPFQAVCPKCGKESTTRVNNWDGEKITFSCKTGAVVWTKGCGFAGKISPFSGNDKFAGKLPWKVEWPVKWEVIGITIEGAGKDHMSAGGSHDIAKLICSRVLKYPVPYPIAYEFFLIGGKKMSSSKGLGTSAREVSEILPAYLGRLLFTRTDYREAIEFDPVATMAIPDLFDEYDRCWQAYNNGSDENLSRIFEYSQIDKLPKKNPKLFLPRFRDIANYIQHPTVDMQEKFSEIKGSNLTDEEKDILEERRKYARIWVGEYAPFEYQLHMTEEIPKESFHLKDAQRKYLKNVIDIVKKATDADELQLALYNLSKEMELDTKDAFATIYTAFLGKTHGPKAAWFLLQYPREQVIKRLQEVSDKDSSQMDKISIKTPPRRHEVTPRTVEESLERTINTISRKDLFSINSQVKKAYPSISIGIAVIRGVNISKSNAQLENEKKEFMKAIKGLTTEELGKYQEIISYRKLYKEMGIDWHSRRPSPEALFRRIALNKGLYTVNTCVDAYNLVVMKHRVSVGAFDLDQIEFPTVLRFAGDGDEILLLGDKEPTKYTAKELAYYDRVGGYNIDFNYRDGQRTKVTQKTKNLWINVDGVYDISPEAVQRSLRESVDLIVKYCGGSVELEGVVV